MKNLTLLLIPLLFLSSCTIDWNDEKDRKITELNQKIEEQKNEIKKIKDDDLFKKNKECYSMLNKLEEDAKKNNNFIKITTVFYSPILKSCIGHFVYQNIDLKTGEMIDEYFSFLKDVFSNQDLMHSSGRGMEGYEPKTKNIEQEIIYLKNGEN